MDRHLFDQLRHLLRPLRMAIANSIARAVVTLVADGKRLQLVQIGDLEGGPYDDCERFQQYGFSSVPLAGAEAVVIFPNGDRSRALVVAVDDRRYRPTGGQAGDVFLYNDQGTLIRIRGTEIRLGSQAAAQAAIKGDTFLDGAAPNTGLVKLLELICTGLANLGEAEAGVLFEAGFNATLGQARSSKVKLE